MNAAGTSLALSIQANAASQEALDKACLLQVRGYEHDRASVNEMHSYAACIDRLHPSQLEHANLIAWKVVVVLLLLGMVVGIVRHWTLEKEHSSAIEIVLMGGAIGFAASAVGMLFVFGILSAVVFLFA